MSPYRAWTSSSAASGHVALISTMTGGSSTPSYWLQANFLCQSTVVTPGWAQATPPCTYLLARPASTIHAPADLSTPVPPSHRYAYGRPPPRCLSMASTTRQLILPLKGTKGIRRVTYDIVSNIPPMLSLSYHPAYHQDWFFGG